MTPRLSQATRDTYERLDLSHRTDRRHHGNSVLSRLALGACDADFRNARKNRHSWVGLELGPAIAGAIAATALAFVLDNFGLAIGLALSSASPTWRDTSFALVLLSGLYLVLAALAHRDSPCGFYSDNHLVLIASHTRSVGSDTECDEFGTRGKPHRLRARPPISG
jgi:hypothetical protein